MTSSKHVEIVESFTVVGFRDFLLTISSVYFLINVLFCPCLIDELQVIWEEVQDIKKWTDSKRQSEAEVGILTDNVDMLDYFYSKFPSLKHPFVGAFSYTLDSQLFNII